MQPGSNNQPPQNMAPGAPPRPQGAPNGMPPQGMPPQGMPGQGMPPQGMPPQGMPGMPAQQQAYNEPPKPTYVPNSPTDERPLGPKMKPDELHIDELLNIVVEYNASDLHISQDAPPVIRHDGKLKRLNYEDLQPPIIQRMMYEIISDDNITKFENTLELDFSYALPIPFEQRVPGGPKQRARFRVNLYRERGAVAAAFRLIASKIPTVDELSLPQILKSLVEKPRGLILVTGPTGSGKSTSLAAMINHINTNFAHHIITIEDPVEYLHEHKLCIINQRELGGDTKSFNNALRASLREDPDILLVGEMRDVETISLAITAAETGHLVFATLHTNNAAESVDRMIDVFPPGQQEQIRVQLSNNLVAIISQQLLPRAQGKGRVPANEIMLASPAIRNLIREAKTHQITSMIQTSGNMGMITMDQYLRDIYLKGWVSLEQIMERCTNPDELRKMLATGAAQGPGGGAPSTREVRR